MTIKLSREAYRNQVTELLKQSGVFDTVLEVDARDSATFFTFTFDAVKAQRKAIMISEAGKMLLVTDMQT